MFEVGIITSQNIDNRLYYEVNQRYEHYLPFRVLCLLTKKLRRRHAWEGDTRIGQWQKILSSLGGARVVVAAGVLVERLSKQCGFGRCRRCIKEEGAGYCITD